LVGGYKFSDTSRRGKWSNLQGYLKATTTRCIHLVGGAASHQMSGAPFEGTWVMEVESRSAALRRRYAIGAVVGDGRRKTRP